MVIADHAPCRASTTQPLFVKPEGFDDSATFSRVAHTSFGTGPALLAETLWARELITRILGR